MTQQIVALVGRPNVGKSTLFNRIVGRRLAVVDDRPGTTRDRLYAQAEWNGIDLTVVDTGGIEFQSQSTINRQGPVPVLAEDSAPYVPQMRAQAELAIQEADAIVLVTDAATGLTGADEEVADVLRRAHCPVFVAANKADNPELRDAALEFYALGLSTVFPISAIHGVGVADLLDEVVAVLPDQELADEEPDPDRVGIAIVGRPNVGKSSLLNKLVGEDRTIVSPVSGTTRDAIDTHLDWEGTPVTLIDTAGIRRRGKVVPGVEKYSVIRALRAIHRADVALLLIDGPQGVTAQDAHVASYILDEWASVVVVINKWDEVEKDADTMDIYRKWVQETLRFMDYVPIIFISALTGRRVQTVIPTALAVHEARFRRLPTGELNRIVRRALDRHSPPSKWGKRLKIFFVSQPGVDPPTFVFHVNDPDLVHFGYERYLENQLRMAFDFPGTPLRMFFRRRAQREA